MTRDDCLIAAVPFFVPQIASSPLSACRAAHRAAERGVRIDCLPRNRSVAHDTKHAVLSEMIRDAWHIDSISARYSHIFQFDGNPAFPYNITMAAASRLTPSICDTENGERSPPFAYRSVPFYAVRSVACHIRHLGDPIERIRFAHFP